MNNRAIMKICTDILIMCIFNHSLINCVIIARTVVLATISVWLPYTAWREALALLKFVEIDD